VDLSRATIDELLEKFLNDDPAVRWAEVWLFVVLEYWMEKKGVQE
jgi:hypothetical protein